MDVVLYQYLNRACSLSMDVTSAVAGKINLFTFGRYRRDFIFEMELLAFAIICEELEYNYWRSEAAINVVNSRLMMDRRQHPLFQEYHQMLSLRDAVSLELPASDIKLQTAIMNSYDRCFRCVGRYSRDDIRRAAGVFCLMHKEFWVNFHNSMAMFFPAGKPVPEGTLTYDRRGRGLVMSDGQWQYILPLRLALR